MRKYKIFIIFSFICILLISSCDETVNTNSWGQTVFYQDWGLKKYLSDTLERTLLVSFNEESGNLESEDRNIVLSLYKFSNDGKPEKVDTNEVQVIINGVASEDNTFIIGPTDTLNEQQKLKFGIVLVKEFLQSSEKRIDRTLSYFFKIEKNNGYDRLNDLYLSSTETPFLYKENDPWTPIDIYVEYVENTHKIVFNYIICTFILGVFFWFLIFKQVCFPCFKVPFIYVGVGDDVPIQKKIKGCIKCIITSSYKPQSRISRIIKGKIQYVNLSKETGIDTNIEIKPISDDSKSVRIIRDTDLKNSYQMTGYRLRVKKKGYKSNIVEVRSRNLDKNIKIYIK